MAGIELIHCFAGYTPTVFIAVGCSNIPSILFVEWLDRELVA